jgi:hypothetical protein
MTNPPPTNQRRSGTTVPLRRLFPNALTRARGLGLMPKKELLLWAPRATDTLPTARPRAGGEERGTFRMVFTRAKGRNRRARAGLPRNSTHAWHEKELFPTGPGFKAYLPSPDR